MARLANKAKLQRFGAILRVTEASLKKYNDKLHFIPEQSRKNVLVALEDAGNRVRNEIINGMRGGQKSGHIYPVPTSGGRKVGTKGKRVRRTYRASGPGEYPAVASGALIRDIKMDITRRLLRVDVGLGQGPTAKVGYWLEFGTKRMRKRPWLRPSFAKHKQQNTDQMKQAMRDALRAARAK